MEKSINLESKNQPNQGDTYPLIIGMIYVFNLILGTGVLTMPNVFSKAGYVLGLFVMTALCFISYIHLTFVVEALANANFMKAIEKSKEKKTNRQESNSLKNNINNNTSEVQSEDAEVNIQSHIQNDILPLAQDTSIQTTTSNSSTTMALEQMSSMKDQFAINRKLELGSMTEMFLPNWFSICFFLSITMYMVGDLIIYNAMMSKSLRDVMCTFKIDCMLNSTSQQLLKQQCWPNCSISRMNAYRLILLCFILPLIPLTYAGLTKNKFIQIVTIILRWIAFFCMIGIAIKILIRGEGTGKPVLASFRGFPHMFGVCVYAFMCHHSLPSMLTPIADKTYLYAGMIIDFSLVLACYFLITLTGIFAFNQIEDVYTLNFVKNSCKHGHQDAADIPGLNIFLPLYPVFTTFSSYTIIALTLINNLKVVLGYMIDVNNPWLKYTLPLFAIILPLIVSMFTENVGGAVSIVGAYTGSLIQYVFPTALVYYSRKIIQTQHLKPYVEQNFHKKNADTTSSQNETVSIDPNQIDTIQIYRSLNPFISYFQHNLWIWSSAAWWTFSIVVVTINYLVREKK